MGDGADWAPDKDVARSRVGDGGDDTVEEGLFLLGFVLFHLPHHHRQSRIQESPRRLFPPSHLRRLAILVVEYHRYPGILNPRLSVMILRASASRWIRLTSTNVFCCLTNSAISSSISTSSGSARALRREQDVWHAAIGHQQERSDQRQPEQGRRVWHAAALPE